MNRQIITLTTEWNHKAYYSGAVKGALLNACRDVNVVDISHSIVPFNILQTAFILKNSYKHFPDDTIHIIGVNSEQNDKTPLLFVKFENQYFLGADNGVFSLMFDIQPEFIIKINVELGYFSIFPELEVFPNVIQKIIDKKPIEEIGVLIENFKEQSHLMPVYDNISITGHVVHIDAYFNAITNISKELFEKVSKEREFDIFVQNNFHKVNKINKRYSETNNGDLLAIFNTSDFLEIAIKNGPATSLLNLELKSSIRIKFYDN